MPPLVGRETFRSETDLGCHSKLEFIVGNFEECKEFSDENSNVLLVDESVRQFKRTSTYGNVSVTETVEDDVPMPLNCVGINSDNLV